MKRVRDFHSQSWDNPFFDRSGRGSYLNILRSLGLVTVSAALTYGFVYSPFLRVNKVEVKGVPMTDEARVKASASQAVSGYDHFILPKDHLLAVDPASIKNTLMALYPNLLSVDVKKTFDRLNIAATERSASYRMIIGDRSYLLDQEGTGMREAEVGEGDALIALRKSSGDFLTGRPMVRENWLLAVKDLHKYFATHTGVRDKLYHLNEVDDRIEVVTVEDWYAIVDPNGKIEDQLKTLSSALSGKFNSESRKNILYIDARFGDRVFFLPK